jgi:hypothetical protein
MAYPKSARSSIIPGNGAPGHESGLRLPPACLPAGNPENIIQVRLNHNTGIEQNKGDIMRTIVKLSSVAAAIVVSRAAAAQALYGYNVSWGVQSVPLSPWVSAAIGLMLLLAAHAFLRRHAGRGVFMLAMATLVGAATLYAGNRAYAPPSNFPITTPVGTDKYTCYSSPYQGYQNLTGNTIALTVTPWGGAPNAVAPNCATGTQLAPNGGFCFVACLPD